MTNVIVMFTMVQDLMEVMASNKPEAVREQAWQRAEELLIEIQKAYEAMERRVTP